MTRLFLYGVPQDRARIESLASKLDSQGYRCELMLDPAAAASPESAITDADASSEDKSVNVVCWTSNSVGIAGQALEDKARQLKEQNAYLGLLLDDVTPPETVRSAQDIAMSGWDRSSDEAQMAPLLATLRARLEDRSKFQIWRTTVMNALRSIHQMLERVNHAVSAVKKLAIVAALTTAYGMFHNVLGAQDSICSVGFMHRPCRYFDLGHLPTEQQQADWDNARKGSDCKALQKYLLKYGSAAAFAVEVQHRLDLKQDVPATYRKGLEISYSVGYGQIPLSSRQLAMADLAKRASSESASVCKRNAQAFSGEFAPGEFHPDAGEPACNERDGGYVCRASGILQCSFLMSTTKTICPSS